MKGFNNLLFCELYKISRKKTLLKLAIAVVVIVLIVMIAGLAIQYLLGQSGVQTNQPDYERQIELLEQQLAILQESTSTGVLSRLIIFNEKYSVRAQITFYKYLLENNIAAGAVTSYSTGDIITTDNTLSTSYITGGIWAADYDYYTFTTLCTSTMMTAIVIFMIVMASRTTLGEFNSGAMKMQLMRSIDRNKFLTAKWLSVYIVSIGVLLFTMIFSFLVGIIAFGASSPDVLLVVNASGTMRVSAIGALIISFLIKCVYIFAVLQLTVFVNMILKRNASAIALNIVISVMNIGTIIETVAAIPFVGFAGFLANIQWESALGLSGPAFKGMTLWSMIPISFAWIAFFMVMNYMQFRKREI